MILLDNKASIHRDEAIRPALAKEVNLKFHAPYCPKLNRIEVMWRLMKHRWLAAKRRTEDELERAVEHVFEHFGGQFKMDF